MCREPVRVSDIDGDYNVVQCVDGCGGSHLFDHPFTFPEVQEAFPRQVVTSCTYYVVVRHKLHVSWVGLRPELIP